MKEYNPNKIKIPADVWVSLYADISIKWLEELYRLNDYEDVWRLDENGDEVFTNEGQETYNNIVDEVEETLSNHLSKGE